MRPAQWTVLVALCGLLAATAGCPMVGDPNDPNSVQPGEAVDFLLAEVVSDGAGGFELRVSGIQPSPYVRVELAPAVYIVQPDYWRIEVRAAALPPGSPPVLLLEYSVSLPLDSSVGWRGIEVAGATRTQRFDVPP